jgi:GT2 family glycosyltransferase
MAIISLTSIPPRFARLRQTLDSLLRQNVPIDEIRLYLPRRYRRFPDYDGGAPAIPPGVRLIRTADDLGPASKILHAADDLRGHDDPILFCDDDKFYPPDWASLLLAAHRQHPDKCIAGYGNDIRNHCERTTDHPPAGYARIRRRVWDPSYRFRRILTQLREGRLTTRAPKPHRRRFTHAGYSDLLFGYAGACVRSRFFDAAFYAIPAAHPVDVDLLDDAAMLHDRNALAHVADHRQIVADHHEGQVVFGRAGR